ncbi:MAG: hypothetical protein JWN04_5807 [Myxococcaceae bacterium]|nr:hypothetical protein [Myxococcaceae bacterium]
MLASTHGAELVDLGYVAMLRARGFEVDWTESLDELNLERLEQYHAVVLFESPGSLALRAGAEPKPGRDDAFKAAIEQYVSRGGGVLLMPEETNVLQQRLGVLTDAWGARIPAERIVETDERRRGLLPRGSSQLPLAYTESIAVSPVTEGVRGIWYPSSAPMTLPLVVDGSWQVLVRASPSAHSESDDLTKSIHPAPGLLRRAAPEQSPALFAVRQLGKGRIALMSEWPQFSFVAGTKWLFDRVVLERGARGKPSGFGRLLENTLRWLSQPSLETRRVALGSRTAVAPNQRQSLKDSFKATVTPYDLSALDKFGLHPTHHVYRGLIGARSTHSKGRGTVAEYARAARKAGLDFVVFLEPFDQLEADGLKLLETECEALSGADLRLFPGFSIATNVGNRMFFFGPRVDVPPPSVLTGPKQRTLYIQEQDAAGVFTGNGTPYLEWVLRVGNPQAGYFDFASTASGIKLHDARAYSMAAIRYYRNGSLVEDLLDDYLLTAAGTIPPTPVSINEVASPADLLREASSKRGLTYVVATSLSNDDPNGLFQRGLRWSGQFDAMPTFVSSGPRILAWPGVLRANTYGAEGFCPERSLDMAQVALESEQGLREYAIYDGTALFRRVALHGAKSHRSTLVLDGSLQRNLVMVVTDRAGGTAVSFARRSWSDGTSAPVFCSDHVNDCRLAPLLAHGPWWLRMSDPPLLPDYEAGVAWDGAPQASLPALGTQYTLPDVILAKGSAPAGRMSAIPILESSDEGATEVVAWRKQSFAANLRAVTIPWFTYGPLSARPPEYEHFEHYRQWLAHSEGAAPYGWAGFSTRRGSNASLFTSRLAFRAPVQALDIRLATFQRSPDAMLAVLPRTGDPSLIDLGGSEAHEFQLDVGDAIAVFGKRPMNAHLLINRASAVRVQVGAQVEFHATGFPALLKASTSYSFEVAAIAFALEPPVQRLDEIRAVHRFLEDMTVATVLRGTRSVSPGIVDLTPADGAVEVVVPQAPFDGVLPGRIQGLNARWSAGLLLRKGYLAGFYGPPENRYRGLSVTAAGSAYLPLDASRGETHVLAGHPVVADLAGKDLFIQVTCLGGSPMRWHVSVNNPLDRPVRTRLHQAMILPGLDFAERQLTVAPGELINLQ